MDNDNALSNIDDDGCSIKIIYSFFQSLDINAKRPNISNLFTNGKILYPMSRYLFGITTSRLLKRKLCLFVFINIFNNNYKDKMIFVKE